jgi:four helix bundle protein
MRSMPAYKNLEAWRLSMTLVEQCYKSTAHFPREELYGLTSQIRRAAVSIPANLAEGYCRRTTKAYANHVSIALGSQGELETCIELARRLGFMTEQTSRLLEATIGSVGRLLSGLYRSLKEKIRHARERRQSSKARAVVASPKPAPSS